MTIMNTHEEIIITNPSEKLLALVERMREHKRRRREEMRNTKPLFTIKA